MPAWIIGGAAVLSAGANYAAGEKQADAVDAATAEEKRQFDLQWGAGEPYRAAGENALGNMAVLTGEMDPRAAHAYERQLELATQFYQNEKTRIDTWQGKTAAETGSIDVPILDSPEAVLEFMKSGDMGEGWNKDWNWAMEEITNLDRDIENYGGTVTQQDINEMIQQDPSYQFRLDEGQGALENYMSGGGGRWSGNALRAIDEYGQDYASQEYQNVFNRNATIAGFGPAASTTPQNNISSYMADQGNVAANQITGTAGAINQGLTNWISYDQNQQMMNALNQPTVTTDYGIPMQSTEYVY